MNPILELNNKIKEVAQDWQGFNLEKILVSPSFHEEIAAYSGYLAESKDKPLPEAYSGIKLEVVKDLPTPFELVIDIDPNTLINAADFEAGMAQLLGLASKIDCPVKLADD